MVNPQVGSMPRTRHAALLGALLAILCALSMLQADAVPTDLAAVESGIDPEYAGARSGQDLIIDYIYASWTTADAGDRKSVSVRLEKQGTGSSTSMSSGVLNFPISLNSMPIPNGSIT